MIRFISFCAICLILSFCRRPVIRSDKECDSIIVKATNSINEYYYTYDISHIDSALLYLSSTEGCHEKYKYTIALHKIHALFLRSKYKQAIDILENIDDASFPFVEYKEIIKYKIKVEQTGRKKKFEEQRKYYKKIVTAYKKYFDRERSQLDSILTLPDVRLIAGTEWGMFLSENYYYKSKIMHKDVIIHTLDSLRQAINGNKIYFDRLKSIARGETKPRISFER